MDVNTSTLYDNTPEVVCTTPEEEEEGNITADM